MDEGGIRVPFIINWPGKLLPGTEIHENLAHIDVLPTLLELVSKDFDYPNPIDGVSFAPLLKGETDTMPKRNLFTEWSGGRRVISGSYLLVNEALYDISQDSGQVMDIRQRFPVLYDSLSLAYQQWYDGLNLNLMEVKPIPVGFAEYPETTLPAHEANLYPPFEPRKDRRETGIAYHSLYGWAHDWVDFWTKTDAYAQWEIDVVESSNYEISLGYALSPEDAGVKLSVEIGDQSILLVVDQPFVHQDLKNHDRVFRDQEAPETDWGTINAGKLIIRKGPMSVTVKSLEIPGKKSIELKDIKITRCFE